MDTARRIGPQRLSVPARAEGPDGEIGDGMQEIGPSHPQYSVWAKWIDAHTESDEAHEE